MMGNGKQMRAMKPGTADAQCIPKLRYMMGVKRGKAAASVARKTMLAAATLAV